MAHLPEELFLEILPWLPVKSLLRFRCVSKFSRAEIDSPNFIDLHLSKSSQNFNLRKLVFQDRCNQEFHVCDVNLDLEEDILRIEKPVSSLWKIVGGHCKGLLLLHQSYYKFVHVLWNPSTHKFRDLPEIPLKNPGEGRSYDIIGSGLGYDDSINDYRALFIVPVGRVTQVWIYGLKSNTWRRAQNYPGFEYVIHKNGDFGGIGYFADGSLHWLGFRFRDRREAAGIVAFDMKNETFSLVPIPALSTNSTDSYLTKLHVLEGRLCISYKTDLYMMKKDEVDMFTWTKLFSVTEPLSFDIDELRLNVLGYSKSGDKILLDVGKLYMVSYDLKEKRFAKVEIHKYPYLNKIPIFCLQSLVTLSIEKKISCVARRSSSQLEVVLRLFNLSELGRRRHR